MTLAEAIKRIDKSPENSTCDDYIPYRMLELFDIYDGHISQPFPRLIGYYLRNDYCTDTKVGTIIYFLDDEPICISYQPYRKSDEEFKWISYELAIKTKEYIESLRGDNNKLNVDLVDINEEIGEGYSIEYYSGLINNHIPKRNPTVNGVPVESITPNINKDFHMAFDVDVKTTDGEVYEKVPMSIIKFEYNLIPKENL